MSIVKGVSLNDIHFGIRDSKRVYDELVQFKDFVQSHPDIQVIFINGDYFDCKLAIGDPATFYAMSFFNELIGIARSQNIIVRMLQGTRSHELNQLQLFKPFEGRCDINFKIIETVTVEELLGLKILYVPEEYPENSDEYYADYKKEKYNIMCVHGTFDFVAQPGVIENSKRDTHSAPVLMWDEWKDSLENGFATCGHIHGRNTYKNKIYYSGSFSRWNFGERSDKGFTYFEYDTDNLTYTVKYIDNEMAPKYNVLAFSDLSVTPDTDIQELKKLFDELLNDKDCFRIDLFGLPKEKIEVLKESYKSMPNIKIEVREDKKITLKESEKSIKDFEKWHYITKRSLPLDKTIQKYCKEELNKDLTLKDINSAIGKEDGE